MPFCQVTSLLMIIVQCTMLPATFFKRIFKLFTYLHGNTGMHVKLSMQVV